MQPANYSLAIYQGATWRQPLQWKTSVNGVETPVDITGFVFRSMGREDFSSTTTFFSLTIGAGITINDAVQGKLELSLTDEQTAAMSFTRGRWDLEVVYPSGDVDRILQGNVVLFKEVTR